MRRRVSATLQSHLKLTPPLKMPPRTFGIQITAAIRYVANFGEESINSLQMQIMPRFLVVQAKKARMGSKGMAPLILGLGTRWGE
jgi:energy-coupling factor transporter transmembrane protein EcfT